MAKKELTGVILIRVDGELTPWETLPAEQRREISNELNERALNALGYVRSDKIGKHIS